MVFRCRFLLFLSLLLAWNTSPADCEAAPSPRKVPAATDAEIAIATLNLWRLRDQDVDARYDEALDSDVLDARLQALARHVVEVLSSPHLIAVQEVENIALLEALGQRIEATGGPSYRVFLHEGNDPSGIDVGLMVREPVVLAGTQPLFPDLEAARGYPLYSRPPLHAVVTSPFSADLVVVHMKSGRDIEEAGVRARRRQQALRLRDWVLARQGADRAVIVAGDLNSAGEGVYGEPARILSAASLASVWRLLPAGERFSFIHRCKRQPIDTILFSPEINARVSRAAVSRGEAGHYRELYGSQGAGEVVTDHDSPVLYLKRNLKQKGPSPGEEKAR